MNMRTLAEMIESIGTEARRLIPDFPVEIQPSADDDYVLCVRVYAVPRVEVGQIEDIIFDLEERLPSGSQYILLPMVKNMDVTREHYPEYMPPPSNTLAGLIELIDNQAEQRHDWCQASSPAYGSKTTASPDYALAA